jgi:alanine racemase
MAEVVSILDSHLDYFQIDDIEELRELRRHSQKPVLLLGYVQPDDLEEAVSLGCELALYDSERLEILNGLGEGLGIRPRVHLKIDALLGRQGIVPRNLPAIIEALRSADHVDLIACYAHFANIEDTTDLTHAQAQVDAFEACHKQVSSAGWPQLGRHVSSTAGLMTIEGDLSPNDLVRLGIGLYGLYPSAALARSHAHLDLRPAMRWVSHLAQVKTLPPKHPVGYGLTFVTYQETRIGIVPQGYADGFDRGLSNTGEVLVRGRRCPVLGRVAMNMFAVDLTHMAEAAAGDEVVLLGEQGGQVITAEEVAAKIGTINYEVVTRVSSLLPRSIHG